MLNVESTTRVYQFILHYITQHEALPTYTQIALAVVLTKPEVGQCIDHLRGAGRIEPGTLLPTTYSAWWREHMRKNWSYEGMRQS